MIEFGTSLWSIGLFLGSCRDHISGGQYYNLSYLSSSVCLPGLAFDRSGRRLGHIGGWGINSSRDLNMIPPMSHQEQRVYYDVFLKNTKSSPRSGNGSNPFLVVGEGAIAITPIDVPVDALVSPSGFIPISPAALERYN
ncbi:hypothetical protein CK203_017098 [Vitis vinifera]|uniref:Uncharacterized protein n=1 Tax=Vitis vinifera TaxID=29760 RepID=A0A438JNV9_VITVI|nr:hypothetical protein CK203_017098 [Vitis vinifera]